MNYTAMFFDDYSEGAHPQILAALSAANTRQERGYGEDEFTREARDLIRKKINQPAAAVHFVATGTHANLVSLASLLKPYESVIAASSGHINVYEAGAIEATGHKINIVPAAAGKITAESIQDAVDAHRDAQMVQPKVVYISQSTEVGTLYREDELRKISAACRRNQLYLYVDGARIGGAVTADEADLDLPGIAAFCDLFYIGGTKNGGLMGEAIVIVNPALQANFGYHLRQRGALLAKARSVSVQFVEFFKQNLYLDSARHANQMAKRLAAGIRSHGYEFFYPPATNLIFPILPNGVIENLQKKYGFYVWSKSAGVPGNSVIRLVCSWATQENVVEEFLQDLGRISSH